MTKANGKLIKPDLFQSNRRMPMVASTTSDLLTHLTRNEAEKLVHNEFTMLRGWFWRNFLDPARRDLDRECGYPPFVTIEMFRQMYDREGIGTRVCDVWPDECWKTDPQVYEEEDEDTETDFEKDWNELQKKFSIYQYLKRIDKMSGIGFYGLILLGLNDKQQDLAKPVLGIGDDGLPTGTRKYELRYLRCFDESQVTIANFETDKSSPRFGHPKTYLVRFFDPRTEQTPGAMSVVQSSVHWTRVVHFADNRSTSEIYGIPRMRPVWNRLMDLRKLLGASAEMFYKGGFPGHAFEVDPKLADIEMDTKKVREEAMAFQEGLSRIMAVQGMHVNQLAPAVADPSAHFDMQVTALCIQMGIPKRIFMGSEQGELASGQDKGNWNGRVEGRQIGYVTPFVLRPFIDRVTALGMVRKPKEYHVDWADLNIPSDMDKAAVCLQRTQALVQYVQGMAVHMITERDYLVRYQGFTTEEANAMVKAAADNTMGTLEKAMQDEMNRQLGGGKAGSPLGPGASNTGGGQKGGGQGEQGVKEQNG